MATVVEMPKFGLSMEEGTIVAWLKEEGEAVEKGEPIAEITTEKITNTVEAPTEGVLRIIIAEVDETLACGEPIAIIAEADEDISLVAGETVITAATPAGSPAESAPVPAAPEEAKVMVRPAGEIRITPKAEKFAKEKRVDYSGIFGTGIGGAITIDDVKKHIVQGSAVSAPAVLKTPQAAGQAVEKKMSQMRSVIADRMMQSLTTSAQTTMAMDVDVTELVMAYNQAKAAYKAEGYKLSYTAILIKAVAKAIDKHEKFRTSIVENNVLKISPDVNIGIAVDIEDGLVVPVLKNANSKDVKAICKELEDLASRARENRLAAEEMNGGTITVTNLGMFGIKYFTPILNLPESAILGVGTLTEQPMVKDGGIFVKWVMTISLTHDHRVIDGAPAARFLNELKDILANPVELL